MLIFKKEHGFTIKKPHSKYDGTMQHFFATPNSNVFDNLRNLTGKKDDKTINFKKKNLQMFLGL